MGVDGGYVNQSNNICNDFMPYMSRHGFVLTCLIAGRHSQQIVLAHNPEHLEAFCSRRTLGEYCKRGLHQPFGRTVALVG